MTRRLHGGVKWNSRSSCLEKTANQIKAAISGVPAVSSLVVEPIRKVDEIHIKLTPGALAYYGVDRAHVGAFVQTALNGETVSQVVEGHGLYAAVSVSVPTGGVTSEGEVEQVRRQE